MSIQLSHVVPTWNAKPSLVRTGFERVIAHRSALPFAHTAKANGVVDKIDETTQTVLITYNDGSRECVHYGEDYTNNAGGGFYITQKIALNGIKAGDKVKAGDVLLYNSQFFTADPWSKQVYWNIGIPGNVAFIEDDSTLEDGSSLSTAFAAKMGFEPVMSREILLLKTSNLHKTVAVGDMVRSIDPLLVFDTSAIPESLSEGADDDLTEMLERLNRHTPYAKYSGKICKIEVYHKCPISEMSKSLQPFVKAAIQRTDLRAKLAEGCVNATSYLPHMPILYTDRIGLSEIGNDDILIRFYIQVAAPMGSGDKLVFDSSLKSVVGRIMQDPVVSEDGSITIDAEMGAKGISNRIVNSPILVGVASRVLENVKANVLKLYFQQA